MKELKNLVNSGHIDVYPADSKQGGAYEICVAGLGIAPYILLNYSGYIDNAGDLAHEGGHAMYSYLSDQNNNLNCYTVVPTVMTQEIASTANEYVLYRYVFWHYHKSNF